MIPKTIKVYLAFGILFIYFLLFFIDPAIAQNKLKVGVVVDLSGYGAAWGQSIKNGMQMAMEDLGPDLRQAIEIIFEDDQLSAKNDATAFNKLANIDKVDAIISLWSTAGNVIAPLADQKGIPLIAIASDRKIAAGRKHVVNIYVDPAEEARLALIEAKSRGYKKIAMIATADTWAEATIAAFEKVNQGQIAVVLAEQFPINAVDFRSFVLKTKQHPEIDAIMIVIDPGPCAVFVKQYREQGGNKPLFAFETFEDRGEVERSGGAMIGHWFVNVADPDKNFSERYQKKYGNEFLASANGYDALTLLVKAYEQDKSKKNIVGYLTTVKDYHGAMGIFSAINNNDFSIPAGVKLVTPEGSKQIRTSADN